MFEITHTEFGWAVFLNGLVVKLYNTQAEATAYVLSAHPMRPSTGAYTSEATTPGAH